MPGLFQQITAILTQPYGSMAYHLVISFIFIGVLYPALVFSSEDQRARRRMLIGIAGLLVSQLLIFTTSALALLGFTGLNLVLPVLDRVVSLINIVIIIWLFGYLKNEKRWVDITSIGIIVFILLGGSLTTLYWVSNGEADSFVQSYPALSWNIAATFFTIFGQFLIARSGSKTRAWGQILLLVLTIGEIANLLPAEPNAGDYSIILRLTYLISLPLLYGVTGVLQAEIVHTKMIVTKIPAENLAPTKQEDQKPDTDRLPRMVETKSGEPVRGIDLHLFQNSMALASSETKQEVCHLFTRYTAHALVSDICLLLSPPDEEGQVHLISAYDLIVQESFSPFSFDHSIIPGYFEALENGEPLQVSDEISNKISSFAHLIMVDRIHSMLIYPITGSGGNSLAAICLVSPYSHFRWTEEDQDYLKESAAAIAGTLERVLAPGSQSPALERLTEQLENSEKERRKLIDEMASLSSEMAALSILADEQTESGGSNGSSHQLAEVNASIEVLERENHVLKQHIQDLEGRSRDQIQRISQLEGEVVASPTELEELSAKLQEALRRAGAFEQELNQARAHLQQLDQQGSHPQTGSTLPTEQAEVIASIAQELRQPMSSISGYTDLLISESVGILGALQKKFLERVKASTDRMNHLIGDLIQITTLDSGTMALTPQPVEIIEIVDSAIETTSGQFREKDIALRVDINSNLPKMHTDKDALQQIMLHLLQNAGAATPEEGEIHVKIEPYNKTDSDIILIAVSDSGEGIPKEDLPRVFSRLYRADNPLIPGVGDTGVGLSIAKTLAEALGGRIWVESDQGVGSTFSVLLPITSQTVASVEG